jgi:plastocyanin
MPVSYSANTIQTVYKTISHAGVATSTSSALSSATKTEKRGVRKRTFAGAIMFNAATSQALSPTISITNGTITYKLDNTTIQPGDSAVWSEEEYGVELDSDQYVSVAVDESLASGDVLYVFFRFRDVM